MERHVTEKKRRQMSVWEKLEHFCAKHTCHLDGISRLDSTRVGARTEQLIVASITSGWIR